MRVYGIPKKNLSLIRKFIIKDLKNNNSLDNYIEDLNLQTYLYINKEIILANIDYTNGKLLLDITSNKYQYDLRCLNTLEICKKLMDGRGLFTEHFNGNNRDKIILGDWDKIDSNSLNYWYHEDRIYDPLWFKQCVCGGIGAGGHPTENICGNVYPVNIENSNKWYILLSEVHSCTLYKLNAYLRLKQLNIPVLLANSEKYLTDTQIKKYGFTFK